MSIQLVDYVNTFYKQINTMQLFINKKKNKNKFKIKDGIITLEIKLDTNNIICNWCSNPKLCSLRKCRHVYFLLLNHFNLNLNQIALLWRENNWEKFIQNNSNLPKSYQNEDCGICLDEIEKNNYIDFKKIYQCLDCGNFSHHKCLKQINKDHCIFCYKENNPSLPF